MNAAVTEVLASRPDWRAAPSDIGQGVRGTVLGRITFADVLWQH